MKYQFDLQGKRILLTGSSGFLGSKFKHYLRGEGATVIGWDIKERKSVDITDKSVATLVPEDIDGLVLNAAIDFPPDKFPIASYERVLSLNISANMRIVERVGFNKRRCSVVLIGSVYGMVGPDQRIYQDGFTKPALYSITKSALYGMARHYAALWGKRHRINVLTFGGVENGQSPVFREQYSLRVPMKRMAVPEDYFGPLHFLLSDASGYMTGSNVVVDGGLTAW